MDRKLSCVCNDKVWFTINITSNVSNSCSKKSSESWNVFTGYLKHYYTMIRIKDESEGQSLSQHYKWFLQSERLFLLSYVKLKVSLHKEVQQRYQRLNGLDSFTPVCFKKALAFSTLRFSWWLTLPTGKMFLRLQKQISFKKREVFPKPKLNSYFISKSNV